MLRLLFLSALVSLAAGAFGATNKTTNKILIVVGPGSHGPGTHEEQASARLLKYCLDSVRETGVRPIEISDGWPTHPETLTAVRTLVFVGDGFPPYQFVNHVEVFAQLSRLVEDGCSLVCIHYATSVKDEVGKVVPASVEASLFEWLGGFGHFLPNNAQPGTQAKIMDLEVTPTSSGHPILNGVTPFAFRDEPYYPITFDAARTQGTVTALATALVPADAPKKETVAWCVERSTGSRSVSILFPHFYENWQNDALRKLVLNGILWSAGVTIPTHGFESTLPALETFAPKSVKPIKSVQK